MTLLEGIFIVAGFLCICISFFVSRNSGVQGDSERMDSGASASVWTEQDEKIIQERVERILEERQAELVDETEDKMNQLCNEKIMAIDEFSQQILEKIDSNHQEVVFMYNMLSEKQKEIKDTIAQPVKRTPVSAADKTEDEKPSQAKKGKMAAKEEKKEKKTASAKTGLEIAAAAKQTSGKSAFGKKEQIQTKKPLKPTKKEENKEENDVKVPGNVNLQIQKMYKEGKSILEISKALNIGQGEVKLVIALYGGRTR